MIALNPVAGGGKLARAGNSGGGPQQWDPRVDALIERAVNHGHEGQLGPPSPFASVEGQRDGAAQSDAAQVCSMCSKDVDVGENSSEN